LALALVGGENGDIEEPLGGHRLARALNAMVQKGLVLTVVLDCCFAASFYRRGHTNVRFTPPSTYFASNSPIKTSGTDPDDEPLVSRFRDVPMLPSWMMNPNGYAVLAACGPREEATEIIQDGNHHGALSRFLYLTLRETRLGKRHKDIYYRLCSRFRASPLKQNPALYGNNDQGFSARITRQTHQLYQLYKQETILFFRLVGHMEWQRATSSFCTPEEKPAKLQDLKTTQWLLLLHRYSH
jgi:hypothetical protein